MYDSILVPADGSGAAKSAAAHAGSLARAMDAGVHVLGVVDLQSAAGPFAAGGVDSAFRERLEAQAADWVTGVEETLLAAEVSTVETAIRDGNPGPSILEYGAETGVDAIAMGTHGRRGLRRFVTGSVTEHVLRRADVPVLTARADGDDHDPGNFAEVLVPTDGSEYAAAAVDHAMAVARAFDGRVHAVSVVDPTDLSPAPEVGPTPEMVEQFERARAEAAEAVAERARGAGLAATSTVRRGTPARALLDYAGEEGVDLIAMGTHGRTGPRRLVLGSTTERLVRRSDVPVLTVRAAEPAD